MPGLNVNGASRSSVSVLVGGAFLEDGTSDGDAMVSLSIVWSENAGDFDLSDVPVVGRVAIPHFVVRWGGFEALTTFAQGGLTTWERNEWTALAAAKHRNLKMPAIVLSQIIIDELDVSLTVGFPSAIDKEEWKLGLKTSESDSALDDDIYPSIFEERKQSSSSRRLEIEKKRQEQHLVTRSK